MFVRGKAAESHIRDSSDTGVTYNVNANHAVMHDTTAMRGSTVSGRCASHPISFGPGFFGVSYVTPTISLRVDQPDLVSPSEIPRHGFGASPGRAR